MIRARYRATNTIVQAYSPAYSPANAYRAAVIADGGTVDSVICVRSTFTELNNVAT